MTYPANYDPRRPPPYVAPFVPQVGFSYANVVPQSGPQHPVGYPHPAFAYAPHNPANAPSYLQPATMAHVVASAPPQNGRSTAVAAVALPHFPNTAPDPARDLLTRFKNGEVSMEAVLKHLTGSHQNNPPKTPEQAEQEMLARFQLRERGTMQELLKQWEDNRISRGPIIESIIAAAEEDPYLELFLKTHIEWHTHKQTRRPQ